MRKLMAGLVIGIILGHIFSPSTIQAVQSMLTAPVTFAIRNDQTGQVLIGKYTVVATRVGSHFWRIEASGKTDDNGYIRTQASANLPPAIVNVLAPLLR